MASALDIVTRKRENQLKKSKTQLSYTKSRYYRLKSKPTPSIDINVAKADLLWEEGRVKDLTKQVKKLKKIRR